MVTLSYTVDYCIQCCDVLPMTTLKSWERSSLAVPLSTKQKLKKTARRIGIKAWWLTAHAAENLINQISQNPDYRDQLLKMAEEEGTSCSPDHNRVREFLDSRELSIAECSRLSAVSYSTIQRLAQKPSLRPTDRVLNALSKAFDVEASEFLKGE